MPRFLTGDELGNIKSASYDSSASPTSTLKTLYDGSSTGRTQGVQKLAVCKGDPTLLASAHADGTVRLASLADEDALEQLCEWRETRFTTGPSFIGMAATQDSVYSCASNGALRRTRTTDEAGPMHQLGALPSRLMEWQLGSGQDTFAYGGDEVEVSIWNVERAFGPQTEAGTPCDSKKRKRADALFPGEIWRAKNVANDYLGLRQPVHNTCLTYLSLSSSSLQPQVLAGTRFGDLRRYDVRAGRRPVNDYKGIGKVGGIRSVEEGLSEHQAFVSDQGTNIFAVDLRTGGVAYGYKGISGAVNSLAIAPSYLVSASLDRFIRVHSTFHLPLEVGKNQEHKGTVLEKVYMTTIPTVVIWDHNDMGNLRTNAEEDDGDVWEQLKHVGDEDQD